jgi:hypothetical protein
MGVILDTFKTVAQPIVTPPEVRGVLPETAANAERITIILNTVFAVIGAIAVMMIIIGGIKYSSSMGDPQAVAKARETIIYSVVGLIVTILAVVIVDFVFGRVA